MGLTNVEPLQHFNPLMVTVLPKERRSRHPYQLGAMFCLLTLGIWQLAFGALAVSAVNVLDRDAYLLLNWVYILSGAAGIAAAIIPERIVRIRVRIHNWILLYSEFDATYFRLWEEFGCHMMLFSVWVAYGQTTWASYGLVKGYSFGLAAAIWFGAAALVRSIQILRTLWNARTFHRAPTAIVGQKSFDDSLGERFPLDGEL